MHSLNAHFHNRYFRKTIFAIQNQWYPSIDVIHHWLIHSLLISGQLYHAYGLVSNVETIEKFLLKLLQTINRLVFQVMYQSNAFPFSERTNCFTKRSPCVPALIQVSTKWATCCLGFPLSSNCCSFGGWYFVGINRQSIHLVYGLE